MIDKKESGFLSLWLIFLFMTSVDTIIFGTNINKSVLYIPRIIGLLSIIALPIIKSKTTGTIKISLQELGIVILLFSIITISSVINAENEFTYISRLLSVLLAYTICQSYSKKLFSVLFDNFMAIVSFVAILFELLAYTLPSALQSLPTVTNTANGSFYTCFFGSIQSGNLSNQLIRANAVFWEPGAFAIYLIFAIMNQLFILESTNIKRVILYIISIVFTFSTTGYVTLGVLLITFIISNRTSKMSKRMKVTFSIIIIGFIGTIFLAENSIIYTDVIDKLTSGTSSATTRYSSLFNGLSVALDHPILGVASQSQNYMSDYVYAMGNRYSNGGTIIANTIIGWSVNYGLVFGFIFVWGSFKYLKQYSHTILEWIMLSIVMVMAYSGERFFSFFPFIFVFYGFKKEYNKGNNSYENCSH